MKNRIRMIITALLICVCVFIPAVSLNAADESDSNSTDACEVVKYEDLEEVKDYLAGKNTYPTKEGYLFAGWYTTDDILGKSDAEVLKYAVRNSVPKEGAVYALFVPTNVLDVKAQLSGELLDGFEGNDKGSIRFVTTVNSLLYQKVGFEVSYVNGNGAKKSATSSSNKVYDKLYAVGSTTDEYMENGKEYFPTEFSAASKFFKACNLKNIPASDFGVPITVKPFWVTLDGSKVYGETVIKSMDDYFLAENVYVSNSESVTDKADAEGYGTAEKPYATLNYALSKVKNQGTVHVVETYATDANFDWEEHNKTVNITGGELDFTTLPEVTLKEAVEATDTTEAVPAVTEVALEIRDSVRFADITLNFADGQYVFANGNTLEIAESVVWGETEAYITLVGGSHNTGVLKRDTNLILNKGQYKDIYGAGYYYCQLNGDVNITLGGSVNSNINYFLHEGAIHRLFGGGYYSAKMTGDINITIASEDVKFNYIYGAGRGSGTDVTGNVRVNFAGKAMSVYGGGTGTVKGDTYVTMTGGWAEQVFGGCSHVSMTGNTNVDIQGGEVERRVYGGCYNELSWLGAWQETYSVAGHTNVAISPKASISYDCGGEDLSTYAISRGEAPFENEWGAFVFNETSYKDYESKLGHTDDTYDSKFSKQAYHYLITTNGNTEDGSLGTVSPDGAYIRIKPRRGYSAVVVDKETNKEYYTESEGVFKLPELTAKTDTRELIVTFSEISSSVDKSGYEARIDGAYYESFEEAVAATAVLDSKETVTVTVLQDLEVANQMDITSKVTIQNESGRDITIYRGTELATTNMFNVTSTGTLTLAGVEDSNSLVFDGRTQNKEDVESTGSLIKAYGNLTLENLTMQYAKKTSGNGGAVNCEANLTVQSCTFSACTVSGEGGAIYSLENFKVRILDSTFINNESTGNRGGAICIGTARSNPIEVSGCTFEGNTAKTNGGAIRISAVNKLNITDSTFEGNTATNEFGGAVAMGTSGSTLNLHGTCIFTDNSSSSNKYGGGGAVFAPVNFNIKDGAWVEMSENNCTESVGDAICVQANAVASAKFVVEEGASLYVYDNTAEENNLSDDICITDGTTLTPTADGSYGAWKPVAKVGNVGYETLASAMAASGGEEVQVIRDATLSEDIILNGNIILNAKLTIADSVTIATDGLADRNIYCGTGVAADNVIEIEGTELEVAFMGSESSQLIFDGADLTLAKSFVSVPSGTADKVTMQYVSMKKISSTGSGAAVHSSAPLNITNCKFDSCASTGSGGAVYCAANLTVQGCEFVSCSANGEGGAVYAINNHIVNIVDSTFVENESIGNRGGAICIGTARNNPINIGRCTFECNTAKTNGGAIRISAVNTLNITDSTFDGNTATNEFGGAVAMGSSGSTLNLYGTSIFIDNTSSSNQYGGGGAVFAPVNFNIKDGAWVEMSGNNCTKSIGDALCVQASAVSNAKFFVEEGAALYVYDNTAEENNSSDDICITDGTALSPTVSEGGSFGAWKPVAKIGNAGYQTLAEAVDSVEAGGEIQLVADVTLNEQLTIAKTMIISTDGVADRTIYCGAGAANTHVISSSASDIEITFEGKSENSRLIFDGNSNNGVKLANAFIYSGKADESTLAKKVTMQYVTMQNIISTYNYGSAVCSNALIEADNCKFIECKSTHSSACGGAIYTALSAAGTQFTNCQFEKCFSGRRGGAIYSKGAVIVESCRFTNNESVNAGGAILMDGSIQLDITASTFNGNKAGHFGGAVAFSSSNGATLNLYKECVFSGNTATYVSGSYNGGGAIFASQNFYIHNEAVVEISGNYCSGFTSGHAIGINYKATNPVVEVIQGGKLYVYGNDSSEDVDSSDDICKSDGTAFSITGEYFTTAPTTE